MSSKAHSHGISAVQKQVRFSLSHHPNLKVGSVHKVFNGELWTENFGSVVKLFSTATMSGLEVLRRHLMRMGFSAGPAIVWPLLLHITMNCSQGQCVLI